MNRHIFGSPGRTSAQSELETFRSPGRADVWKAELQSRLSGSVKSKLQIFRSPGRAKVRKLNLRSLAVKAGWKNWQSRNAERNSCHIIGNQGRAEIGDAEAEIHIIGSQDIAEVWKRYFTSLADKAEWKWYFRSLADKAKRT